MPIVGWRTIYWLFIKYGLLGGFYALWGRMRSWLLISEWGYLFFWFWLWLLLLYSKSSNGSIKGFLKTSVLLSCHLLCPPLFSSHLLPSPLLSPALRHTVTKQTRKKCEGDTLCSHPLFHHLLPVVSSPPLPCSVTPNDKWKDERLSHTFFTSSSSSSLVYK